MPGLGLGAILKSNAYEPLAPASLPPCASTNPTQPNPGDSTHPANTRANAITKLGLGRLIDFAP